MSLVPEGSFGVATSMETRARPRSLYGSPAWLHDCDTTRLRKILRDCGVLTDPNEIGRLTHEELLERAAESGLGPGVPDEWALQMKKAEMQAESELLAETLSPRSRGRLRAANRRKPTPVVGGSPKYMVAGERRFKPPPVAASRRTASSHGRLMPARKSSASGPAAHAAAEPVMKVVHLHMADEGSPRDIYEVEGEPHTRNGTTHTRDERGGCGAAESGVGSTDGTSASVGACGVLAGQSTQLLGSAEDVGGLRWEDLEAEAEAEAEARAAAAAVVAAEAAFKAAKLRAASAAARARSTRSATATTGSTASSPSPHKVSAKAQAQHVPRASGTGNKTRSKKARPAQAHGHTQHGKAEV